MPIVIVEGCDGSGKTTLISNLRKATKRHFITLSRNGRPRKPEDLLYSIPWIAECPRQIDLVCDRHPLISEWIYGPHVRNEPAYVGHVYSPESAIDFLSRTVDRVIYCRPPKSVIVEGIKAENQMDGVEDRIEKIIDLYDEAMGRLFLAKINVLYYDCDFPQRNGNLFRGSWPFDRKPLLRKGKIMDRLKEIIDVQRQYLERLAPVYLENGAHIHASRPPWPLNERMAQEEFRLLAWRITEEVYEALEANAFEPDEVRTPDQVRGRAETVMEEVSDVCHFLIELAIVSGVSENVLVFGSDEHRLHPSSDYLEFVFSAEQHKGPKFDPKGFHSFLERLATSMMLLKQRPWRTDNRTTSKELWERSFFWLFRSFVQGCIQIGMTADDLHGAYFAKNKINHQRQQDLGK